MLLAKFIIVLERSAATASSSKRIQRPSSLVLHVTIDEKPYSIPSYVDCTLAGVREYAFRRSRNTSSDRMILCYRNFEGREYACSDEASFRSL
jgi:hypothetical protein